MIYTYAHSTDPASCSYKKQELLLNDPDYSDQKETKPLTLLYFHQDKFGEHW
jgi:hypothetical protein